MQRCRISQFFNCARFTSRCYGPLEAPRGAAAILTLCAVGLPYSARRQGATARRCGSPSRVVRWFVAQILRRDPYTVSTGPARKGSIRFHRRICQVLAHLLAHLWEGPAILPAPMGDGLHPGKGWRGWPTCLFGKRGSKGLFHLHPPCPSLLRISKRVLRTCLWAARLFALAYPERRGPSGYRSPQDRLTRAFSPH